MDKQEKEVLNKRTTIHDVAHEAGVSMTTVSHALNGYKDVNEQTRQKIVEIAGGVWIICRMRQDAH